MKDVRSKALHDLMRYLTFICDTYQYQLHCNTDIHFLLTFFCQDTLTLRDFILASTHFFLMNTDLKMSYFTVEKCRFCIKQVQGTYFKNGFHKEKP